MSECKILLNIPELGIHKEFNSNEALDGWLYDHRGILTKGISEGITYELAEKTPEQNHTYGMIQQLIGFHNKIKAAQISHTIFPSLGGEEVETSPVPISITEIPKYIGPKKVYPSKQKDDPGYEIAEKIKDARTGIGDDFELAFDYVAKGKTYQGPKVIKDPEKVKQLIDTARIVYNKLIEKHGANAIFLTQVEFAPKDYTRTFLDAIRIATGPKQSPTGESIPAIKRGIAKRKADGLEFNATGQHINAAIGRADLVVIDEHGVAHIYDFKTSGKELVLEDHADYAIQVAGCRQVFAQWEIPVADEATLIPIRVSYNGEIDPNLPEQSVDGFSANQEWIEVGKSNQWSRVVETWFPSKVDINYGGFEDVNEVIEVCFPGGSVNSQERNLTLEVEDEMKSKDVVPIKENDRSYKLGNRIRYYKRGFLKDESKIIDAKTPEELKEKMAAWIVEHNKKIAQTNTLFADDLKKVLATRNIEAFRKLAPNYNQSDTSYILSAFGRYITEGWELVSNDLMITNGYFLFQRGDIVEMVTLSTHNIFNRIHFDHGKTTREYNSIMGQFASDEDGMDNRWVLPNFYGNMEFMKSMIFFGKHPEIFKNKKINKISVLSLLSPGYMEESNEKLVDNYKLLATLYEQNTKKRLPILSIGSEITDDVTSYVNQARDLMQHTGELRQFLTAPAFAETKNATNLSLEQLAKMINTLRGERGSKMYKIAQANFKDESWKALQYLWRAFTAKISYQISPDVRTGAYTNGGLALDGHMSASAADSKSAILRTLHEATYSWARISQTEFVRYTSEWKKAVKDFYISLGHNQFWGGEYNLYNRFFQQVDGQLDNRFILKPRGTMDTEAENKILDLFYTALDRFKYNNNETRIQLAIQNGTYGEVPLIRGQFVERAEKGGITKALLDDFSKDWLIYRDFLLGADISAEEYKQLENLDATVLPSLMFDDDQRSKKLDKNGTDKYTTDLDYIFNLIVAEGIKRETSPQMLMTSSAIRGLTKYMIDNGANFGDKFEDSIEKYVKRKIFNRPIIGEGEENLQAAINIIKGITSSITLAASMKAFTRESLTGIYRAYERVGLRPDLQKRIKIKDYTEALTEVIEKCYENTDVMSWHMQLNAIYGTANFSYDQMAKNSTIQQFGLKNFQMSDLFFTATWPDFIHRNAIVIAYLKGIGAYKAYSMVDGILTYDMDKDERFQTFLKYKTREDVPISDVKQWEKEYNTYQDQFNSWKNNGYRKPDGSEFKFGDKLPQALSPREVLGLKDIADRMYGNYDDETKSLMRDQLLGSLFLQFRTYGINRLREFFDGDHFTSDIHMEDLMIPNENGELEVAYMVKNSNTEAVANGEEMAYVIKRESEINPEQIRSGEAVRARRPVSTHIAGGQVQGLIDMAMTLFIFKNQDEFDKMWKNNPNYRANVALFLIDTFGMLLLSFIINELYKGALQGDYDEIDWFTKWSYNVAIGVTQDGPLWTVVNSVIGDGNPPMIGILQNYTNNIMSVLTGKENFMYGLVNTFGATRELAYLFHNK